ncbi:hypothetical protein VTN77DRAFT_4536 [Rasamsonia byssochlamydoides]|uniref:uncharacterized protein n=1 Tax=Rasamsonia byssochlamydoides TaxID=89139 RepID=UPI003742B92F
MLLSKRPALARLVAFQRVCTFSTSSYNTSSASSIASAFLSRFQSQGPQVRTQILDANQLQLLSLTLDRPTLYPGTADLSRNAPAPATGTPIPPGYHLVYFTPAFLEHDLGADGTDTSYNPDAPFTRRMWAGGEVRWPRDSNGKLNLLRVGQEVRETTRVLSAEPKVVRKTGEEMIVVGVEKTFENEEGVAVVDRRNWVFRKALPSTPNLQQPTSAPSPSSPSPSTTSPSKQPSPTDKESGLSTTSKIHKRTFTRTPVTLFRFSALTFNSHKIHYLLPWAREVEGHRNIVVHGPLNLISILDFWRDVRQEEAEKEDGHGGGGDSTLLVPESISYRATSPLYADEEYQIVLEDLGHESKVNIYNHEGVVAMKADIKG